MLFLSNTLTLTLHKSNCHFVVQFFSFGVILENVSYLFKQLWKKYPLFKIPSKNKTVFSFFFFFEQCANFSFCIWKCLAAKEMFDSGHSLLPVSYSEYFVNGIFLKISCIKGKEATTFPKIKYLYLNWLYSSK